MKLSRIIKSKFKDQRGAVAVIVAVSMAMLIGFVALAIDVGYLYATKNELQNVADAAALAAAGKLGDIYSDPDVDPLTYVCGDADQAAIRSYAKDVVGTGKNSAGGKNISILDDGETTDILINNIKDAGTLFDENNYNQPDAVRVIARRDDTLNGQISMFFARIFNIDFLPVTADATAALTSLSIAGPGGLPLPIAINKAWMETKPCNEDLTLYPSSDDACAAWHSYTDDNGYSPNMGSKGIPGLLEDITSFGFDSPETIAGETQFDFTNATAASLFTHENFEMLFDSRKGLNDGVYDMDENSETWTLSVPIFEDSGLSACNPSGLITIVGFASITIKEVLNPPDKIIVATVICEEVKPGRGGGADYGTKGSIPGLVE